MDLQLPDMEKIMAKMVSVCSRKDSWKNVEWKLRHLLYLHVQMSIARWGIILYWGEGRFQQAMLIPPLVFKAILLKIYFSN